MVRYPAVADQFYPGDPDILRREVESYLDPDAPKREVLGVVAPHAGYVYSGRVAGKVFSHVEVPPRVVVLGVNHRGSGERAAIMNAGAWDMPNGSVDVDADLAERILAHCPTVRVDPHAHRYEHSLEVQIPFLQALRPDFKLTPIALSFISYQECTKIAVGLAESIRAADGPVLLVASSDMTHYETQEAAHAKDRLAIERILALDPQGLYETVIGRSISMCGVITVTIVVATCIELGASKSELVDYATSGDVNKDYSQVVGYAGLLIL